MAESLTRPGLLWRPAHNGDRPRQGRQNPLLRLPAVGDNAAMETEPKRKRRWFQFSLRTLLIFTLVVAMGCAWLAGKAERKRRERAAVEALRKKDAWVIYDDDLLRRNGTPPGPAWVRWLLGENYFRAPN
jgi:hypothetical protein